MCKTYNLNSVKFFGSYARGDATDKSDVDLFVDSKLKGLKFVGLIEDFQKALGYKTVDLLDSSHVEINSPIAHEIQKIGVELYA